MKTEELLAVTTQIYCAQIMKPSHEGYRSILTIEGCVEKAMELIDKVEDAIEIREVG